MKGVIWALYPTANRLRVWYYRRFHRLALDRDEAHRAHCLCSAYIIGRAQANLRRINDEPG